MRPGDADDAICGQGANSERSAILEKALRESNVPSSPSSKWEWEWEWEDPCVCIDKVESAARKQAERSEGESDATRPQGACHQKNEVAIFSHSVGYRLDSTIWDTVNSQFSL